MVTAELFPVTPKSDPAFWFYAGFTITRETAATAAEKLISLGLYEIGKFTHRECPYDHFFRGVIASGFNASLGDFPQLAMVRQRTSLTSDALSLAVEYDNLESALFLEKETVKNENIPLEPLSTRIYKIVTSRGYWSVPSLKANLMAYLFASAEYSKSTILQKFPFLLSNEFFERLGRNLDLESLNLYLKIK